LLSGVGTVAFDLEHVRKKLKAPPALLIGIETTDPGVLLSTLELSERPLRPTSIGGDGADAP
jgi:hypothetical protein